MSKQFGKQLEWSQEAEQRLEDEPTGARLLVKIRGLERFLTKNDDGNWEDVWSTYSSHSLACPCCRDWVGVE